LSAKKPIVNDENVNQIVRELLDLPFWPKGIKSGETYRVQTDDTDGKPDYGWLMIQFSGDGDAWVSASSQRGLPDEIRFRTFFGGGEHLRVLNAILVLAVAMKLDMDGEGNLP
jgi:hypothetical protein